VPGEPINRDTAFDPTTGSLARFLTSLMVVDTMRITIRSLARFGEYDQVTINTQTGGGLWQFYTSNSASGASTVHEFDSSGRLTVTIISQPGVPIVLGANVLSASDYVT
jgi:hypothetical protein